MTAPGSPAPPETLLDAALGYAARGWPVFPCSPETKQPLLAAERDRASGRAIRGTGGVSAASDDAELVRTWWERRPKAMIGVAMGQRSGCFALDFDPQFDEETGEVLTLDSLKAATQAQIGDTLPPTLAARTPSGGVHLYFLQPGAGDPVRNRGNLPPHVDVRGEGGYVIAPPSVMADGRGYRWLRGNAGEPIAEAPARLVAVLRSTGPRPAPAPAVAGDDQVGDAVRKYALAALDGECRQVRQAASGQRNAQLNTSAMKIAGLVAAAALDQGVARAALEAAARANPGRDSDAQLLATIDSGWSAGTNNPRDLREVATASRERPRRSPSRGSTGAAHPGPVSDLHGRQSSRGGGAAGQPPDKGVGEAQPAPTRRCAFFPQTDLGNLERFLARHGEDFLYVEQWGWHAWDGRRWNRDMALPMLGYAVQRTMRAIQEEAKLVAESGVPAAPSPEWDAGRKAEHAAAMKSRLDRVIEGARGKTVLLSDTIAKWGRTSESAGHIGCIAKLAEARLAAAPAEFDADPLKLNMQNGTLVFARPDGDARASVAIREHRREDRATKLGGATYDAEAACPLFDAFLEEVQPAEEMRAFLDVWGGYNALGLADAQKMALFYGEGSNGKGVWINTVAHILGDYAWAAAIETFIDQGKYRKGSDASPDLAALAGRRMVYANEPEENSKFSDGLIKAMTSDEPIGGVRELNKPPFELLVTFCNTVSANNKPRIGTDHGIQRRMQVVPWDVTIPDDRADPMLKHKLKAEAAGVLNRFVAGALRYLDGGLPATEAVRTATREYIADNDLLGQFIDLALAVVEGETIGAAQLHETFSAWQVWSGNLAFSGKPWSMKHLNAQMRKKRFVISKSSTMRWHDLRLRRQRHEFVDAEGRPREAGLAPLPDDPPGGPSPCPPDVEEFI